MFHFLLSLRRAQAYLQQCWATLMTIRTGAHCLQAVWQLRTHMGFLIDNLQYYVQVSANLRTCLCVNVYNVQNGEESYPCQHLPSLLIIPQL